MKTTGSSAAALIVGPKVSLVFAQETSATADFTPEELAQQVVAALGDTLIPSDPGDPGYRDLEGFHITEEVMKILALKPEQLETFDNAARLLTGTRFAQLGEEQRESFLYQVIEGKDFEDPALLQACQEVYQLCRSTIFRLFYRNFPENVVPRDANDFKPRSPLLFLLPGHGTSIICNVPARYQFLCIGIGELMFVPRLKNTPFRSTAFTIASASAIEAALDAFDALDEAA